MDIKEAKKKITNIENYINSNKSNLLEKYPVNQYIELIDVYPKELNYDHVSKDIQQYCNCIIDISNRHYLDVYHRSVLLQLMLRSMEAMKQSNLPEDVKQIYITNFNRIQKKIDHSDEEFLYEHDSFQKDIAICTLRLIPTGARKIHLACLSKRFVFKRNLTQFIDGLMYVTFQLRGFAPLFEMHTDSKDPDLMAEFNYEGFVRSYIRISEILKISKHVKGVFATSWFYDPKLENISPRLNYLRDIVVKNGGKVFYLGSNEQAVNDATLKSQTRRKLYNEGKYIPTHYLLVWSREKLIQWADKKVEQQENQNQN